MKLRLIITCQIFLVSTLLGMFVKFSMQEMVERSPVIFEGKVIDIIRAENPNPEWEKVEGTDLYRLQHDEVYRHDRAIILVSEVIKQEVEAIEINAGDKIDLFMPAVSNKTSHSTDIRYDVADEGVWLLTYSSKDQRLSAGHPMSLQQADKKQNILDIIKAKSNKSE